MTDEKKVVSLRKMSDLKDEFISLDNYYSKRHYDTSFMFMDNVSTVTEDGVPIRKLFVANLAARTTYKDLIKVFSKYGEIESCYLQRRNREKSNYAFVTFGDIEAAVKARLEDTKLHNRNLRVEAADSWHQPDSIENQYYNKVLLKFDKKPSNKPCIQESSTETNIQMLNDDCLMHIFLQLPVVDRIRIERVCKRWKTISQESWRSVKRLDLSYMWDSPVTLVAFEINTHILRKVLLRCGRFLNEINLSEVRGPLRVSTLTIVGKLCPNLQRIDVTPLTVTAAGINSLTNNCRDITRFSLGNTTSTCDIDLQKLFQANRKLRYLKIVTGKISGTCLLDLPYESMEEIVLRNCISLRDYSLTEAIKKWGNLKSLTIHNSPISVNVIKAIGTYCESLRTLQLSQISLLIQSEHMLYIPQLTNLEVLKINGNTAVTDEVLINVALKCQRLSYIDITECTSVTSVGIAAIATLPKLEVLIMNEMNLITDTSLHELRNLKRLECRRCHFTDKTIIELIASAPRLEFLDLSWCYDITNLTLEKAVAVTISRTNNTMLKIFIGGTRIDRYCVDTLVSPFLHIVNVRF